MFLCFNAQIDLLEFVKDFSEKITRAYLLESYTYKVIVALLMLLFCVNLVVEMTNFWRSISTLGVRPTVKCLPTTIVMGSSALFINVFVYLFI